MKINRNTVLVGSKVVLVPYRKQHVPRYHEWMKDPLIQEQTASEPLSLDEEYEMQQSWAVDQDKLTFIVLSRPELDHDGAKQSTTEVTDAEEFLSKCKMVGDVNIFFNEVHDDEDEDEDKGSTFDAKESKDSGSEPLQRKLFDAECEIMIAEHSYRREGIAREALQLMFTFVTADPILTANASETLPRGAQAESTKHDAEPHCTLPIPSNWLTCKISLKNDPSIRLFESLGFTRQKVSEVWQEVEMRFTDANPSRVDQFRKSLQQVLFWADE